MIRSLIRMCLSMPALIVAGAALIAVFGIRALLDNPKDAIPDISQNQVIVSAEWMGRSPQDVQTQVTWPLAAALQGIPRVEDVRTMSGLGMSRIYLVFEDGVDIYWARSRVLERLAAALPGMNMPAGVTPMLGPDATALGQTFMYTLEGPQDLATLRTLQDYTLRYELLRVPGVSEIASIGGYVREYQVDLDPQRLRAHGVVLEDVVRAVGSANLDVGAKAVEQGDMEFLVRGVGFIKSLADIESIVVKSDGHVSVLLKDLASVHEGPAFRRGALADDKGERVGGIVTVRYGANPYAVIQDVKASIVRIEPTLPQGVHIVPFYDRTVLIDETLGGLRDTLLEEVIVTALVVLLFLLHLRSSLIVAVSIPLSMLMGFIVMQVFGVESNIMSLGGIAIAIGDVADMSIVMTEVIYSRLQEDGGKRSRFQVVYEAATEVGGAIVTAVLTTVISFLPIFALSGQSYKLFAPLAETKTAVLLASLFLAISLAPVLCYLFLGGSGSVLARRKRVYRWFRWVAALAMGAVLAWLVLRAADPIQAWLGVDASIIAVAVFIGVALLVARMWDEQLTPLEGNPVARGVVAVYARVLRSFLTRPWILRVAALIIIVVGAMAAFGARTILAPLYAADAAWREQGENSGVLHALAQHYPGFGSEFMPPLDEGSLLAMPSLLSQASLSETLRVMQWQNQRIAECPEVLKVMGKLGRADTALDPAPIGMIETVVLLKPVEQWREGMTREKLLQELRHRTDLPGVAPSWLQPIQTRIVMLSSGIRARIGLEILGDDADRLAELARELEPLIRSVEGTTDVTAMRLGGQPYLEYHIRRDRLAHFGLSVASVQEVIETAIGGTAVTKTVEGVERYSIRIRYEREMRDTFARLDDVLVATPSGAQIPITEVANVVYQIGPSEIRGVGGKLAAYVTFNTAGIDEAHLIERVEQRLREWISDSKHAWPSGYTYGWVGQYREQIKANQRLSVIIPVSILIVLLVLYLHFRKWVWTMLVFVGLPLNFAGGALLIRYWPELQSVFSGTPQGPPIYITVAVAVGFLVLAGVVTNDGVIIGTYIDQLHDKRKPTSSEEIRAVVVEAGSRRIRPCLMTALTSIVGLMPILWSSARGSDVMQPMALPIIGGMAVDLLSLFMVPVAMSGWLEWKLKRQQTGEKREPAT